MKLRQCERCDNKGVIRVNYHSGEPFDIALCDCAAGQYWRVVGEQKVREHFQLAADQQVADVEDVGAEEAPRPTGDFLEAAKTAKRAKL